MTTQVSVVEYSYRRKRLFSIPIGLQGQHIHRDPVEEWSDREDRGAGVQQHSETTPDPADDLIRSGTSGGKS